MQSKDKFVRDHLAEAVRSAVDDVVTDHASRPSQETVITSKIAHMIEQKLRLGIAGYQVSAIAQDMPDKGRGSLEKPSGVDLFIGVEILGPEYPDGFSKGLIIQSKKCQNQTLRDPAGVREQCEKMIARSKTGAFLWIYTAAGVDVVPATEVVANKTINPMKLQAKNVGEHFRDFLDCTSGDRALVSPHIFKNGQNLTSWLEDLAAKAGVLIQLQANPE